MGWEVLKMGGNMKRISRILGLASLALSTMTYQVTAVDFDASQLCYQVFSHLNTMTECADPNPENCIGFQVELTYVPENDRSGEEHCILYATSDFHRSATREERLHGITSTNSFGIRIEEAQVEIGTESSYISYPIYNLADISDYEYFKVNYHPAYSGSRLIRKSIYFTNFAIDGVVVDSDDDGGCPICICTAGELCSCPPCTPGVEGIECSEEGFTPTAVAEGIRCVADADDSDTECSEAVNGIRACYDANNDIICFNAQDAAVTCPPELQPRTLDNLPGGGMGADDDDGQAATDGGEGLFCSLNTKASPKGFWFGFGGLALIGLALAGLRRNIK